MFFRDARAHGATPKVSLIFVAEVGWALTLREMFESLYLARFGPQRYFHLCTYHVHVNFLIACNIFIEGDKPIDANFSAPPYLRLGWSQFIWRIRLGLKFEWSLFDDSPEFQIKKTHQQRLHYKFYIQWQTRCPYKTYCYIWFPPQNAVLLAYF